MGQALLDGLYPPRCALCEASDLGDGLGCAEHRLVLGLAGPRCGRCAAPLSHALPDGERCAACRRDAPGFQRVLALCDYRSSAAVRDWLLALKYGGRADLARSLGALLGHRLALEPRHAIDPIADSSEDLDRRPVALPALARPRRAGSKPRVLVPVPLHPLRRLERGFDQAVLLARAAAEASGCDVASALRRVKYGAAQGSLLAPSRTANVHDAFRALPTWWPAVRRVSGSEVWLVDDVVTSGASANACAGVLRALGANFIGVVCVARAAEMEVADAR